MDSNAIVGAVTAVTKKWAKQRKAEERDKSREARRRQVFVRSARLTIKDAAWALMPEAYAAASTGGKYPAHARQIMYARRGEIQRRTGEALDDQYFTQTLLPDYLAEHPEEAAGWDVVFDARGHFQEPHTRRTVPLGTIDVRRYLAAVREHAAAAAEAVDLGDGRFPTLGPPLRFGAVLFIEKEGFLPLFRAVRLAERYDVAVMSTKGMSVTASRALVDALCSEHDVPLLVLRDFDKSGFSIAGTLRRDTRRYAFRNRIRVVDLGLRLEDVEAHRLDSEDVCYRSDPTDNLEDNGATPEEVDFLAGDGYRGRRVELNAFTSGALVTWIEGKLREHGVRKVVPGADAVEAAYRRALERQHIRQGLEAMAEDARDRAMREPLPDGLVGLVQARLAERPELSWDEAVAGLVPPAPAPAVGS